MKKIMYGLMLILTTTIFANGQKESVYMGIDAELMEPLTIRSNGDLDFGNLLPGIPFDDLRSSFTITGEPNVLIHLESSGEKYPGGKVFNLVNEKGDTMPFLYYYIPEGQGVSPRNYSPSYAWIPRNGVLDIEIVAGVRPGKKQSSGVYRGTLVMSVRYD